MNGLDLFSGIGGITKALDGYVTPVAYCENDRYAQAVLLSRMASGDIPSAPVWDDVQTLEGGLLPDVQIIYGGFPCQDISVAGRGAGLAGKRSGLFSEIVRLAGELRPRFIFLENVPAIHFRGGSVVVGTLARLGYDCRWTTLSAAAVGANHRRERWWLLAHANGRGLPKSSVCQKQPGGTETFSASKNSSNGASAYGKDVPNSAGPGLERRKQPTAAWAPLGKSASNNQQIGWWQLEPNVGRVAHGVPFRVDRLRGLGNAVVPAQAREAFERLMGLK